MLACEDFNDDTKDAGELGAGHCVTVLYELVLANENQPVSDTNTDPLKYQKIELTDSNEWATVRFAIKNLILIRVN